MPETIRSISSAQAFLQADEFHSPAWRRPILPPTR